MTHWDLRHIHTTGNRHTSMHEHGSKATSLFLPADGETSWSLFPSLVSFLSGGTMLLENIFPYPQGDRSCLRKQKKDKHQH